MNLPIYAGELPKEVQESLDLAGIKSWSSHRSSNCKRFLCIRDFLCGARLNWLIRLEKGEVLAITGTNGKTTTTALLGKIMSDARPSVFVVGNIGTPYTSKSLEMTG